MIADELAQASTLNNEPTASQPGAGGIDVQRLADLVYRLMVAEVRLGMARGESRGLE